VLRMASYVDTSATATNGKKKRKPHVVFDGEKVFEVNKLTKLKDVDEVFIDTLFLDIYEEVLKLLKRGVKVYLLRDTKMLKKLRMENNMKKSDEVDAQLLSMVPKDGFRLLMVEELEFKIKLRPLINKYRRVTRWRATLKKLLSQGFDYNLKESIRLMKNDSYRISREIIKEVADNNIYREACRLLGLKDSVEVAILTVELPLHLPLNILKKVVGLTPNRNEGRFNHRIRGHLSQLATNIYLNAKRWKDKWRGPEEFKEIIDSLPQEKAIYKLQPRILKTLRKAYFLANNQTINNPADR